VNWLVLEKAAAPAPTSARRAPSAASPPRANGETTDIAATARDRGRADDDEPGTSAEPQRPRDACCRHENHRGDARSQPAEACQQPGTSKAERRRRSRAGKPADHAALPEPCGCGRNTAAHRRDRAVAVNVQTSLVANPFKFAFRSGFAIGTSGAAP
jgi:hypothetical protein